MEAPAEGGYGDYKGAISIDLKHLNKVLEVDEVSRAANIQGGTYGPHLEEQLRPHGLTLRHYPQSFEFSTLGGWIATRSSLAWLPNSHNKLGSQASAMFVSSFGE